MRSSGTRFTLLNPYPARERLYEMATAEDAESHFRWLFEPKPQTRADFQLWFENQRPGKISYSSSSSTRRAERWLGARH